MSDAAVREALALWGGSDCAPRLISHRENAVYEVELPSGRAALRLHRVGYRSAAEIRSELSWTEALVERGFVAPTPVRALDGSMVLGLGSGQLVSVISWMEGTPIGAVGVPLVGSAEDQAALYHGVGGMLARLHNVTDALELREGFTRPRWDCAGLTGPGPLWGRYWEAPGLSGTEVALIVAARDRARARLAEFDAEADCGLIHADALRENVFRTGKGLALIDFDDSGFGYRMYDLASSVTQAVDDAAYPEIVDGLLDGYAAERPLAVAARDLFQMFAMLRAFSAVGWTIPRVAANDPKLAIYRRRALSAAEGFLGRQDK
ncbi:MAG: phosphotransferase [Paracoccaceae bacterium]